MALSVVTQLAPRVSDEDRFRFARSMQHGRVAEVCKWIDQNKKGREHAEPILVRLRTNPDVLKLASIFLRLQQARHEADYDHLATVRKATTLNYHGQAVTALDLVDTLAATPDGEALFALIALHTSLS
jgi:hypothetical protein